MNTIATAELTPSATRPRRSRRIAGEGATAAPSSTDQVPPVCPRARTPTPATNTACTKRTWTEEKTEKSAPAVNKIEECPSPKPTKRARTCQAPKIASPEEDHSCCICMSSPSRRDLAGVNKCGHMFCFDCISTWAKRENSCPLCKQRFSQIARVHPGRTGDNTVNVAPRNQEPPGTRLTLQGPDGIELVLWTPAGMPPHVVRAVRQAFAQRLARGEFTVQQTGGSLSFTELFTAPRGGARVRPPANPQNTMIPGESGPVPNNNPTPPSAEQRP